MSEDWPCGAYEAHVDQKLSEWKENRHVKG